VNVALDRFIPARPARCVAARAQICPDIQASDWRDGRAWSADAADVLLVAAVADAPSGPPTFSQLLLVAGACQLIEPDWTRRRGWFVAVLGGAGIGIAL